MKWSQFEKEMKARNELQPAVSIFHEITKDKGVAIRICENISSTYLSGDIIVFWQNGDYGICDDEDEISILNENIWIEC